MPPRHTSAQRVPNRASIARSRQIFPGTTRSHPYPHPPCPPSCFRSKAPKDVRDSPAAKPAMPDFPGKPRFPIYHLTFDVIRSCFRAAVRLRPGDLAVKSIPPNLTTLTQCPRHCWLVDTKLTPGRVAFGPECNPP